MKIKHASRLGETVLATQTVKGLFNYFANAVPIQLWVQLTESVPLISFF